MKSFLKSVIERLAQRLLIQAAHQAEEMLTAASSHEEVKVLDAPVVPRIEMH
jgi:hypothetical protein